MIIFGYIFTLLNYGCFCISRFARQKVTILTLDLVSKIFTAMGLYCLNSLSGAYLFIAVFFMLIAANIKERLHKDWLWGYIFFQSLYIIILYTTYIGISSILVVSTVSVSLFCNWWLPPQKIRLIGGINGLVFLTYQISIKNWAGLLEILAVLSNFCSFIKYGKKHPKRSKSIRELRTVSNQKS